MKLKTAKTMETINQPSQTETLNVTTILNSNTTQDSPKITEDEGIEDSSNGNENSILKDEYVTTNIQRPLKDKADEGNNIEEEGPMDISTDDETPTIHNDKTEPVEVPIEQQKLQMAPQPLGDSSVTKSKRSDQIICKEAEEFKCAEESKESDEDELLKSENEESNENEEQNNTKTTLTECISMEWEEELLRSEDEEENTEEEAHIQMNKLKRKNTKEEFEKNKENIKENEAPQETNTLDYIKDETNRFSSSDIQQSNKLENNDVNYREVEEEQKINNTVTNIFDEDNRINKCPSPSNIAAVYETKSKKNVDHRILYQFDLDDNSSSQDSFVHSKSSRNCENKLENTQDESNLSQVYDLNDTQPSISETRDIKDIKNDESTSSDNLEYPEKEKEVVDNLTEDIGENWQSSQSPQSMSSNNEKLTTIMENDKIEEFRENIKVEKQEEGVKSLKSPWNTLHNNVLYSSNKNLIIDKDIKEENSIENDLSDSNDRHSYDKRYEEEDEERDCIKSPILNGDHNSCDQFSKAEQIQNTTIGNMNSNDGSILLKSRKTLLDSNVRTSSPIHSPLSLLQNEEACAEFEGEVNEGDSFDLQDSETKSSKDPKEKFDSDKETDLKINENSCEDLRNYNSDNKVGFFSPAHPSSQNEDEAASRSSMASTTSYSSNTSSSQQLVIDHPLDDLKEEKLKPLKITLKRKLSNFIDDCDTMGPQQKQLHLDDEGQKKEFYQKSLHLNAGQKPKQEDKTQKNFQPQEGEESSMNKDNNKERIKNQNRNLNLQSNEDKTSLISQNVKIEDPGFFKSLISQQLEKPLTTLNVSANVNTAATIITSVINSQPQILLAQTPAPSLQTLSLRALTPPPPPKPVTKYLCFKCKTGSFNTFAALEEHQAICLISHSPFSINQTIQTSHSPQSAISPHPINIKNAKSLTATKTVDFTKTKEMVAPSSQTTSVTSTKKRYYKCSSCNTFHENWNLFLHIREKHNRYTCLYCTRFFPTAEKLALHLEIKHDLEQNHFNSEDVLRKSIPLLEGYALESRFLMCCTCQHIFMENELFSRHDCIEFIKPCALCGQKGRHTNQCKAHLDSKRFSKLKKKKEKQPAPIEPLDSPTSNERYQKELSVPPITINSQNNYNPTIILNSILNCDSDRDGKNHRTPTINSLHSEDSNSSSNMVIDESYNVNHIPPTHANSNLNQTTKQERSIIELEPDLPPDRQDVEEEISEQPLTPLKLVVPKFKLRVPKEFQKSVDDALSTSDSEDEDEDVDEEEEQEEHEQNNEDVENSNNELQKNPASSLHIAEENRRKDEVTMEINRNSLITESTSTNSQDIEIEGNLATESATDTGNSQDNIGYKEDSKPSHHPALSLDDDDSLDEPNSNLVRIMQEIERTKLDIQRTKKTSFRHNNKHFTLPRQPTISQSSNRRTDQNWSPTPPASPNSRCFTPRRSAISQIDEEQMQPREQHQFLLPPPSPVKQIGPRQERRDTIGSDVMDIDETITSKPTQTIYCNDLRPLDNENLNSWSESIETKSNDEPMDTSQITDNETSASDVNNISLDSENFSNKPQAYKEEYDNTEKESKTDTIDDILKPQAPEELKNMDVSFSQSTDNENNEENILEEQDEEGNDTEVDIDDNKAQDENIRNSREEKALKIEKIPPADGIEIANEDTVIVDLQLDRPLDKYEIIEFVRICLKAIYPLCLYCNHARRIAVNGKSLIIHMIGNHRFTASVDSITAEELLPDTIVTKLKSFLSDLEEHYFNSNSYCTYGEGAFTKHFNERIFECFQCRFVTSTHKELYLHNRKMHLRTAILCFMCRANFFSFSEILCHICPGVPNKVSVFDVKFRCCLCELDNIPSPFRLMVHLRKKHFACDVCLEDCRDQSKLSSHVWKHKLHHLCYRCGIAYRNKLDITKHLFWKHGTESTICKRCLQKRWRHVYHFCIPPTTFTCEVCNLCFSKAMYLRVHKRLHSGDLRYPCIADNCEEKFISRKLLLKHAVIHNCLPPEKSLGKEVESENSENEKNESDFTKEVDAEDTKMSSDLKSIKQKIIDIKKEPLDEFEIESQTALKDENSEKKGAVDEGKKDDGMNVSKNVELKEKKRLDPNEPRKKRKSKRSKELLEDLNLTAPNLSESDSSDDDEDSDSDSKTKSEIEALPRVLLSPPSEAENEDKENKTSETVEPGQVLEIWKNFLKTQQGSSTVEELERLKATNEENKQPKHKPVHVACSDHDYCKIEPEPKPETPKPATSSVLVPEPEGEEYKDFKKPTSEMTSTPEISPTKKKQSKSPRRLSSRRSDASSSSSNSSSSSDSSCSCGSNCSCSSSDSDSSSSSSSSEDTDSSMASNNSVRKKHRKKSERDRIRKRSESVSPLKQHKLSVSISEVINVDDEEMIKEAENIGVTPPSPPKEPLFSESDLETTESETDEEFYDEHPQKLANELLSQKRAQLMAQTRLSPSHNYDIVENSRPSTPSLPEEVATNEKPKIKVKKKKRDRKSSCKGQGGFHANHVTTIEQHSVQAQIAVDSHCHQVNSMMHVVPQPSSPPTILINPVTDSQHAQPSNLYNLPQNVQQNIYAPPPTIGLNEQSTLTPRPLTMIPYGNSHRMSEGSSCSDADGSLKRSKRQRRPNKFYGYTSDDENLINGPPLIIGTRAFKPQPPPQLTWRKEDLPTPSKSILNNKNKTQKTLSSTSFGTSTSKKKSRLLLTVGDKSACKKSVRKKDPTSEKNFPPIPTLKIRPSEIGLNTTSSKSNSYNTTDDTSSEDDANHMAKGEFSASTSLNASTVNQISAVMQPPIMLPSRPPPPPTPQTMVFNHRIPPALLPNPDFATLQYFKANNIRYPIRPPAGARQPREGESVYCYCRCPYDEVSEMIACDGENCLIEWFHFECVGIMVAPQGKWFCAECRPKYSEELYPSTATGQLGSV